MPLIGTAGHVDHGKSTLITALTGRDPDRLDEEKQRGLTIDLGFAWADLGDGTEVSFVDVPGHERYLKNMLAGIEAIDVAMLVVDSGEGWMPQTEEHLAVLDLLEVTSGVVVLTKIDLVDEETVTRRIEEIEAKLRGSSLEGVPIVPASAPVQSGLDAVREALLTAVHTAEKVQSNRARLWVDRSFTISGVGTVVTGSLLGGPFRVDQRIEVLPAGRTGRIRSLQSHETPVETAVPGYRVAVGLAGVERSEVTRGDMLANPGQWRSSNRLTAHVRPARYLESVPDRGAFQMHIGSATVNAEILRRRGETMLIGIDTEVPIAMGDRFIIRDTGRRLVIAGGRIIDPAPTRNSLRAPLDPAGTPDDRAGQLLELRGSDRLANLVSDSNGGQPGDAIVVGESAFSSRYLESVSDRIEREVDLEHEESPLRDGIPLATLANRIGVRRDVVERVVAMSESLEMRGPNVANRAHRPSLDAADQARWNSARVALSGSLSIPVVADLPLGPELLHLLLRRGDLVRVSEDLVYLPDQIDQVLESVRRLTTPFGVGEFKEELDISRKYAMPLLEWLDANEYTIRREEGRIEGRRL